MTTLIHLLFGAMLAPDFVPALSGLIAKFAR